MKCLGIAIKKNEIWYSLVEGADKKSSIILNSGKQNFQSSDSAKELMVKFLNIFTELITRYEPDIISYKLSLNVDMSQIPYMHFSLGVLNLLCMQEKLPVIERSNKWITAKNKEKIIQCQTHFSDKKFKTLEEKQATLIAWWEIG